MLVRTLDEVIGTERDVDWGHGTSRRLMVASDQRGYAITETEVRPGAEIALRYDNHLESCYCIEGSGTVRTEAGEWPITVGTLYAPDKGETHYLSSAEGMRLVCVFNPPLNGTENHSGDSSQPSGY
jgi:L-ectoine synthase